MARYINPYTDFGFKKLFGEEASKELLIDFLNQLLPQEHKVAYLHFKNNEQMGTLAGERKAIFDIYCETSEGHQFIVEMQKAKIKFFKERAVFYTSFPIRDQAEKGDWDFNLNPVFCIAVLDFEFDKTGRDVLSNVQLKDQYCEVFYDKLTYIFLEMPRFKKKADELVTHFEKWLYFLKYLENFDTIPEILSEPIFRKGFEVAELARYNKEERRQYEESLKVYRDLKGVVDTSFEEGAKMGMEKGEKIGMEKGEKIGMEKGEKIGMEKGEKIGMEKGEKIGMEKGSIQEKQNLLIRFLKRKFVLEAREEALIHSTWNSKLLDGAIDIMFTAEDKTGVFQILERIVD